MTARGERQPLQERDRARSDAIRTTQPPGLMRQFDTALDDASPDWLSAAEKLGLAISAAMLGCAASAAKALELADKRGHRRRPGWLTAAKA